MMDSPFDGNLLGTSKRLRQFESPVSFNKEDEEDDTSDQNKLLRGPWTREVS
jgi:hypothetical protein